MKKKPYPARPPARPPALLAFPHGNRTVIRSTASIYIPGRVRGLAIVRPRRADWPQGRRRLGQTGMNPLAVQSLAAAITQQEGFYPGSVSWNNNNPGNLVYAGQPGATPGTGGFAAFDTLADGEAALSGQINLDASRGTDVNGNPTVTLSQFIDSYAPASAGNDTASYIANVSAMTGYSPDAALLSLGDSGDSTSGTDDSGDAGLSLADLAGAASVSLSGLSPTALIGIAAGVVLLFFANQ